MVLRCLPCKTEGGEVDRLTQTRVYPHVFLVPSVNIAKMQSTVHLIYRRGGGAVIYWAKMALRIGRKIVWLVLYAIEKNLEVLAKSYLSQATVLDMVYMISFSERRAIDRDHVPLPPENQMVIS